LKINVKLFGEKMKLQTFILFLAILLLSSCGPVVLPPPTATPSPTPLISGVPEFLISSVYLGMQGAPGQGNGCVPNYGPLEIRVTIQNQSETPAYNVSVVEHSTATTLIVGELGAWQSIELMFPAASSNGTYNIEVDPENMIPEINEQNNTFSYFAPTPTPPVLCTPTPTAAPAESTPIASLTPAPATEPSSSLQPLVVWQSPGSPCKTASFWADHMDYAACGEVAVTVAGQLDDYVSRYSIWTNAYAPFTVETPAGFITFNGKGFVIATEAEQRMIAEWAARMSEEVPGHSMMADSIVLSNHVSVPDRCFDVTVYRDGQYLVFSCLPGPGTAGVPGYLDANELIYFYRWLDEYQPSEHTTEQSKLVFTGRGSSVLKIAEIVSMETLASNLAARAQGYTSGGGLPSGALAAQKLLSIQLGIPLEQIQIKSVESMDFPDSCLGAPRSNEICAQVATPGLRVLFEALGMVHEFHTEVAGYDLRLIDSSPLAPEG
jgi:hypothetical protein